MLSWKIKFCHIVRSQKTERWETKHFFGMALLLLLLLLLLWRLLVLRSLLCLILCVPCGTEDQHKKQTVQPDPTLLHYW